MCYHPITIINPSKYVSVKYRDRFLLQVPCGKCAACMTQKSNEWYYRLYHQSLDTFSNGGFVQFDTLTYNNAYLPHISDFLSVPSHLDFPCFNSADIRRFTNALRTELKRNYNSNFLYFIVSEYGTSENHLHRPHYHSLMFVTGKVTPLEFSKLVAKYWHRGRTDGLPWRSRHHVMDNTFTEFNAHSIRSIKYITKYIQKSCKFQSSINARLDSIMSYVGNKFVDAGIDNWFESSHYWRVRDSLHRHFDQFHRQSSHLGEVALRDLDVSSVFDTGALFIPDNEQVVMRLNLPTYFKRKLFYELVEVDGSKSWQLTGFGLSYLEHRSKQVLQSLTDRFKAISYHVKETINPSLLADYVLNLRGRFKGDRISTLYERLCDLDYYNYSTRYDKESLGDCGLSCRWLGNSSIGYKISRSVPFIKFRDFISRYVYLNDDYERQLDLLFAHSSSVDTGRQNAYEVKQRLSNLYHHLLC